MRHMTEYLHEIVSRFLLASTGFEHRLRLVLPEQWEAPTPCPEWNVRQLVNHMARGNLNYVGLVRGGTGAEFLEQRDADALGVDPVGSYVRSVQKCAEAFAEPLALACVLDYPLGKVPGEQSLAVRTTDTLIHTWDLARAIGADEQLDTSLVAWADAHLEDIYAGLAETLTAADTTHRFFAPPPDAPTAEVSVQDRLLNRMGRSPRGRSSGA